MSDTDQKKPPKQPPLRFSGSEDIREFRRKNALNQSEFWSRIGVTQSGGSRYESGRNIPRPVQVLLHIAYGNDKQAAAMLAWLRSPH